MIWCALLISDAVVSPGHAVLVDIAKKFVLCSMPIIAYSETSIPSMTEIIIESTTGHHAGSFCFVPVVVDDCDCCCFSPFNVIHNCDKHLF